MKGVEFHDQNAIFGKPEDMTDEQCGALPVKKTEWAGFPCLQSVWELSDADLALINQTKRVRLSIISTSHPPVLIEVEPECNGMSVLAIDELESVADNTHELKVATILN